MADRLLMVLALLVAAGVSGCTGGNPPQRPPIVVTPAQQADLDKQHAEIKATGKYPGEAGSSSAPAAAHKQ